MIDARVLAIVVNWRQPEMTVSCVQALRQLQPIGPQVLVIDNGSGDGSLDIFGRELPDVDLLLLPENRGFAVGANTGLRRAIETGFQYALLINNDAFPATDMLARLMAETTSEIALLSPKILYESEPEIIWFAGGRQHPMLLELRDRGLGELDGPDWQESRDVDYLIGTCLLVNLDAARQVGLLDERYFMYYEDLDWSIRFHQAGYRLRLVADARLYHRISASSGGVDSPLRRYHLARSGVLFFHRHGRQGWLWAIIFFRIGSAIKMVSRLLLQGQPGSALAYLRGLQDGFRVAGQGGPA